MQPIDPSDAHLQDRAIELRVIESGTVAALVAFVSVFYSWVPVFAVFALAYVVYKFHYYTNRIGVYDSGDLSIKHNRLEIGLLLFGVVTVGTLIAIETLFSARWEQGGFLSLPAIDPTNLDALLSDPRLLLDWAIVVAPVVAVSYAGFQLRHRILFGLDSYEASIRATIWESLARLPVYLLWIAVLSMRPIYEVWEPVVQMAEGSLGLTVGTTNEFATVFGEAFPLVVGVGIAVPGVVIAAYLGGQRWKYHDATVPEVLGYRGVLPPSREPHRMNYLVPVAAYLLYTLAVTVTLDSLPIAELELVVGVGLSVLVGADVLGETTTLVHSFSEQVTDSVDTVVVGFVTGLGALVVLASLGGSAGAFGQLAATYPIVALPLTHFGNRLAGKHAVRNISEFIDQVEADPESHDHETVDRLFVYSDAWDDTLRAKAIEGLVSSVTTSSYRRDDALDVFARAIESYDEQTVQFGLRGLAVVLSHDQSIETHDRLAAAGAPEQIVSHLDSSTQRTQRRAAEAAARLFTIGLDATEPASRDQLSSSQISTMRDVVSRNPEDQALTSAVVEYFATVWYALSRSGDTRMELTDAETQQLLGSLIWMSEHVDENTRLKAAFAVTSEQAEADGERFSLAVDHLDSRNDEVRYLATNVVRSSMDQHTNRVDIQQLVILLEDPSEAVRRAGAEAIDAFVSFAPDRAPQLLDRLVLHLEENHENPGLAEGIVIRSLDRMAIPQLIDHPNAPAAIAPYVDESDRLVAEPAARVLLSLVENSPIISREESVRMAIESGLTNPTPDVRLHCLEAVVAITDDSVDNGRQFIRGLGANLGMKGEHGRLSAVCLAELIDEYPEDGLEILPELSNGLGNLTSINRESVPFIVRGTTVSAVIVDIVADVVPLDPGRGEVLIDSLIDFATTSKGTTLERVFEILAELSAEFPTECKAAVDAAAAAIDLGRVGVRRNASQVLANVAAYHPEAVEPFVDRLILATDDDSPRVRSPALVALANVCAAVPAAIESDIHRVIGNLDDDSVVVRKQAANLIVTIAEREPEIVEPAAETADRLRRLQRNPSVDFDPDQLQDASTAIQTGIPADEADTTSQDGEEIWSPETAEEMGFSGDTKVFEPVGDEFDPSFDEEFDEEFDEPDGPDSEGEDDIDEQKTIVRDTDTADVTEPDESADEIEDHATVIEPGEETTKSDDADESADEIEDHATVIEPGEETTKSDDADESVDGTTDES